jgi:hypothetical protein
MYKISREFKLKVNTTPDTIWKYVTQLGIKNGWYAWGHFFKKKYTPVLIREKFVQGMDVDFFKVVSAAEARNVSLKTGRSFMDIFFEISLESGDGKTTVMTFTTIMEIKNFLGSIYWLFIQVPDELLQGVMMANIKKYSEANSC